MTVTIKATHLARHGVAAATLCHVVLFVVAAVVSISSSSSSSSSRSPPLTTGALAITDADIAKEEQLIHSANNATSSAQSRKLASAVVDYQKQQQLQQKQSTKGQKKTVSDQTLTAVEEVAEVVFLPATLLSVFVLAAATAPATLLLDWPFVLADIAFIIVTLPEYLLLYLAYDLFIRYATNAGKMTCSTSSKNINNKTQQQDIDTIEQLWQRHDYNKLGQEVCGGAALDEQLKKNGKKTKREELSRGSRKVADEMIPRVCSAFYKEVNEKGTQLQKELGLTATNSSSSSTSTAFCDNELIQTPWSQLLKNHS